MSGTDVWDFASADHLEYVWGGADGVAAMPAAEQTSFYEMSELGNARRLVGRFGDQMRYAPELGSWLIWDERRWGEDVTGEVMRLAKAVTDGILDEARAEQDKRLFSWGVRSQSAAALRAMVSLAQTEPSIPVLAADLDADPYVLNVENGTLDLKTGTLRPHSRGDLITKLAPVAYDAAAECPTWLRVLEDVYAGDTGMIGFLQRFAGYSLTGIISEHLLTLHHGNGSNGKSTILNLLRDLVGDYGLALNPAVLVAQDHDQHPTGLTDLRGARLVTSIESAAERRLDEALVKSLTGGDPIRPRRMRQDFFQFEPTHKLWLAGNHLPRINGTDHAMWRRLALMKYEVEFGPERMDKGLPGKLAEEAPGILAWAVRGCLEWQSDGLQVPERVQRDTSSYRDGQDHVGRFIADCCVIDASVYVRTGDLRAAYEAWCSANGEKSWSAQSFGRELAARGFDQARVFEGRRWLGIGLLAEEVKTP